jgi:DNA-binding winged helix-turn-helix (wHTH) protein/serine/threonine protein kinase
MDRSGGRIWRFGECEFDERRRELRVRGALVDIEVKPFEILHQLLLNAGEVVTKAELLDAVWPSLSVVEGSLTTAISKLRKLLHDDGTVIVTVPRVGYKLAAPVQVAVVASAASPVLRLEPGASVPGREQWRLTRRLEGSPAAEVWVAEHAKTAERRVFKFGLDEVGLRGLKREVTVARLLREALGDGRGFVRVLEWRFDAQPYVVESEYVGPNLAEWAEAAGGIGTIPHDLRLELLANIAEAVAAAHGLDVLHKDLKPANILVRTAADGTPEISVADFGCASLLAPSRLSDFGITNVGFTQQAGDGEPLSGTPMYVAPEVLGGQSPTVASDVYALGVLLYQLVVGDFRRPFAPGWEADVADPLIREDIAAAAAGDPARRLTSAGELAERVRTLGRRRVAAEAAQRQERAEHQRQAPTAARRRGLLVAGLGLTAVGLGTLLALRSIPSPPEPVPRTVAVLPLQNVDGNAELEFLRLALADEISTTLSRSKGIAVRPFSMTNAVDRATVDVVEVGRTLRADTLVTGRFRAVRDQLQITLEAIDAAANELLWSDTVEAPSESMIAAHVQLGVIIRGGLAPAIGAALANALPEPQNAEAYELHLRSSVLPYDPEPNPKALAMLQRAVELDPQYAPAWLSLTRRYYVEAHFGSGDPEMMDRAVAAGERGAAIDPDDVSVASSLVSIAIERGELARAYARADTLVRRQPDNVSAAFVMSYVLRYAGLLEESAHYCEQAFLIDRQPLNTTLRSCALVHMVRSDFTRALNYLNLDRETEVGKAFRVDMLVRQGEHEEAIAIGAPNLPQWRARYEMLLGCVQQRPAAEIDAAVQPAADPEENYLAAGHFSYCGRTDIAGDLLRSAIQGNYCSFPAMETDPMLANLRSTPGFDEIRAAGRACRDRFLAERSQ